MTDEQVTVVRTTNFFTALKTLVTDLLTSLRGFQVTVLGDDLKVTISDVPCIITFSGGDAPGYPSDVHIVAPEDGSTGGINAILPIEWMA